MPIRPEFRHLYGREWREVVRPRILARAGDRCEQCGVPNHKPIIRAQGWWAPFDIEFWYSSRTNWTKPLAWTDPYGRGPNEHGFPRIICRLVQIVLTVAHLNHVAGDDRDENLKALCQWCHLNYDLGHHHETRAARKDAARPLFHTPTKEATL